MRYFCGFLILAAIAVFAASASAQKGVDSQTKTIKEDANKTTSRTSDASRSFDWGKGKTRVRERLPNPYQMNSRRDVLLQTIKEVLAENKLVMDEASSRLSEGIIVTQPYVFGRGPVIASSELKRYGIIEFADTAWSRGQYSLTIEVQSIDGIKNNVSVNAKIEGRSGRGLTTEWVTVPSSGAAEEEFLVKLVERVTGVVMDPSQKVEQP
ncbi:MAG TPA: hypothetical protein PKE66_05620 [Pyrinomonadaceae bacterium]|nr:hypothetical protein [Pyrinomonadaceae bacterium]